MKILKKRAIAFFIDAFVLGMGVVLFEKIFFRRIENITTIILFILLIPFCFRDLLFRNASIGKKMLGIVVLNRFWEPPSWKILLKRSIWMLTKGYFIFWYAKCVDGNIIDFFDWEYNTLGTRVIDKKILKKIKGEIEESKGDKMENITRQYSEYLRNVYMK